MKTGVTTLVYVEMAVLPRRRRPPRISMSHSIPIGVAHPPQPRNSWKEIETAEASNFVDVITRMSDTARDETCPTKV